ncbi:MAG: hypothetical protein K9N00_06680, partial [Candidatus Marinimicrobia bacterium]|nr:hypothetical protein [Candidatus Neomarinimicrobiota bacterium]
TREVMLGNKNDFEGYKLYRATDKQMSDPMVITDLNGGTVFRKPIFQCDKIDGKTGPADFGLVNGTGYNLGTDSGIRHSFVDTTVKNGVEYYYALAAYDYGLPNVGDGISPSENKIIIRKNEAEEVIEISKNVAVVTPRQRAAGFIPAGIDSVDFETFGNGYVIPEIIDEERVKADHEYKIEFSTVEIDLTNVKDAKMYWNDGLKVYDVTEDNTLIYEENHISYPGKNLVQYYNENLNESSFRVRAGTELHTDVFDGLRLTYFVPNTLFSVDTLNSSWRVGSGKINLHDPVKSHRFLPYDYEIIFSDNASNPSINPTDILNIDGKTINSDHLIFDSSLPFYVQDMTNGYKVATVVHDLNGNGSVDLNSDRFLVGATTTDGQDWGTMAFAFDFINSDANPSDGDSYFVTFNRGFSSDDEIVFKTNASQKLDKNQLDEDMDNIKVVPNPYVVTNVMEPAVMNEGFNQRRRIMFTNIPARCTIKIFTVSGLLVDEIDVENSAETGDEIHPNSSANGTVKWDLLSKEGLEIGAGYYLYHVKSKITGEEKVGKFAVIK